MVLIGGWPRFLSTEQSESGDRLWSNSFLAGFFLGSLMALDTAMKRPWRPARPSLFFRAAAPGACDFAGRQCHESLRSTRGVVMSVSLSTFARADDLAGGGQRPGGPAPFRSVFESPTRELLLRAGVIGGQIPPLQAPSFLFSKETRLPGRAMDPWRIRTGTGVFGNVTATAQVILSRFAKGNDDALVLVARIGGNRQ